MQVDMEVGAGSGGYILAVTPWAGRSPSDALGRDAGSRSLFVNLLATGSRDRHGHQWGVAARFRPMIPRMTNANEATFRKLADSLNERIPATAIRAVPSPDQMA